MSIASELLALQTHITNAYGAVNDKGGTIPASKNMANLATAIASISGGGGNVAFGTFTTSTTEIELTHTITHGLGKLPKFFACVSDSSQNFYASTNSYASKFYLCLTHFSGTATGTTSGILLHRLGAGGDQYNSFSNDNDLANSTSSGGYYFNMDTNTATIKHQNDTSKGLGSGIKYYWVAVADFE